MRPRVLARLRASVGKRRWQRSGACAGLQLPGWRVVLRFGSRGKVCEAADFPERGPSAQLHAEAAVKGHRRQEQLSAGFLLARARWAA